MMQYQQLRRDPEEEYDLVHPSPKHNSSYPHVPAKLRCPKALATYKKEIVNAVTCCDAVEQNPWTGPNAQAVLRACRKKGRATVRAVSLPSEPSCSQQRFMAFEANEPGGHITYIIAFRSDQECFNDIVSTPAAAKEVENTNYFNVHKSLWWRAATMPMQFLPPLWRIGLRDHGHRLILTGFSVGGAVAAVTTLQLLEVEDDIREQICCYTFGTPLQGDQKYADCINQNYFSNFYHVMMDGDSIPGVLTLVSKFAANQPTKWSSVGNCIIRLLASSAQMATAAAINSVAPGGGVIVQVASPIDSSSKLGKYIKRLIVADRNSSTPLPEYKFGGSLVLLNLSNMKQNSGAPMTFVPISGYGRVLEEVFRVPETEITLNLEDQIRQHLHQLKTFSRAINDLDYSPFVEAIRSVLEERQHRSGQTIMDHMNPQVSGTHNSSAHVKDEAGLVAESTSNAAKTAIRAEEEQCIRDGFLLQPHFDIVKPIIACLSNDDSITVEVNGENMVLGMCVKYMVDGEEKLRIPCVENCLPQSVVGSAEDPQIQSIEQSLVNRPLRFSTHGTRGLSFKEPTGSFVVHLAFGLKEVAASTLDIRMFDSLKGVQVAERFSTEHPSNLINLVLFWGVAIAQAHCIAAFYTIKDKPSDAAADIVSKTMTELSNVPVEFVLLDRLLALVDTSHIPDVVLDKLPADMSQTLRSTTNVAKKKLLADMSQTFQSTTTNAMLNMSQTLLSTTTNAAKPNVVVPYFPADNESSASWTFSGRYKRTIQRLVSNDMLSMKESAEKLSKTLDEEIAGPREMLRAYFDHQFKYKEYGKNFSSKGISKWEKEKEVAKTATGGWFVGGAMIPVVNIPFIAAGLVLENEFLLNMGMIIGAPTGIVAVGLAGAVWWLAHSAVAPVRRMQNRPGLMADLKRKTQLADWVKRLEAAAAVLCIKSELPLLACKLEHGLYKRLKNTPLENGRFSSFTKLGDESRYAEDVFLQLAHFGLAGALVHEVRRHLTEQMTSLGLIGSTQAGKSTFASLAFKVDSNPGSSMNARTRVLRHWKVDLPSRRNQQFTLIDFPGSTDQAASDWCIRGQLLATVLVVVMSMKEMNSSQAAALVKMACQARSNDKEVSVLFCFTLADTLYDNYKDEAEQKMLPRSAAKQTFIDNFDKYRDEILNFASVYTDQMEYIRSNMHACCFKPSLQDRTKSRLARELESINVKNVQWVKEWCEESLLAINR